MRLKLPSLSAQLKQGFDPLYLLFGAETLLVEEALDEIRAAGIAAGYQERIRLTVETGFDWNQLYEQGQAMSLFAEKRLIELRLPSGKPGDKGAKALIDFANRLNDDTTLIIISGAIEKRSQGTKWFKEIENKGWVIECPIISNDALPDWIGQRMHSLGLKYDYDAVEHLSHFVEGNLLAAAQEVNLLGLLHPNETITAQITRNTIADHARFNVYTFADACLSGATSRVIRILQSLKREQAEPIVILWALARDTRILCQLSAAAQNGQSPQSLFKKYGIWSNRSALVNSALRRLSKAQWENLLRRLGRADLMVKGRAALQRKDIWEEIENISLMMCGLRIQ